MVSAVTGSTYTNYLSQLTGNSSKTTTTPAVTATSSGSGSSTAQSLVSSLLAGGSYSTSVLSLLQQNSSGGFDPVTSLLGGTGTNDGLTDLYDTLFASAAAANLTQVQADNPATTATAASSGSGSSKASNTPTSAQSLIAEQTQASIAYNQTIQQNAQSDLAAVTQVTG